MADQWDLEALSARIKDINSHLRHEAGSPNAQEVECYGQILNMGLQKRRQSLNKHVVVLGMTPELRRLAIEIGCRITSVDQSEESIKLYKDWISIDNQVKERIIKADWMSLQDALNEPASAILGDGIFGNILSIQKYRELLRVIQRSITNESFLIFRTIMIPRHFTLSDHKAKRLLERFRAGELTEAEFGFGMRIFGSYDIAYESRSFLLDNRLIFDRYKDWINKGLLSEKEYTAIRRYYFGGLNLIPPQDIWEKMLTEEGFSFQQHILKGRMWYEYYSIYYIFRESEPWMRII